MNQPSFQLKFNSPREEFDGVAEFLNTWFDLSIGVCWLSIDLDIEHMVVPA